MSGLAGGEFYHLSGSFGGQKYDRNWHKNFKKNAVGRPIPRSGLHEEFEELCIFLADKTKVFVNSNLHFGGDNHVKQEFGQCAK